MARKKKARPSKIVTTYTDTVELTAGDDGLSVQDLADLVDTVRNELFLDEELVTVRVSEPQPTYVYDDTGPRVAPAKVTVTQRTSYESGERVNG